MARDCEENAPEEESIEISFKGPVDIHIMQAGKRTVVAFAGMVGGVKTEITLQLATSSLAKISRDMMRLAMTGRRK